jgi:hypothetical protein
MSYDMYIETGDKQIESVFNCSVFNMRPFMARVINGLAKKVRRLESQIRVDEDNRYRALNPEYVQGERYNNKPDTGWAEHLIETINSKKEYIAKIETSQAAWVRLEDGEKVSFVDLCMAFSFNLGNVFEENEEYYIAAMISSLCDCARFHGTVECYVA